MPHVKMYTTATCVYCHAQKKWLKEHNIAFEEVHADESRDAAQELYDVSGQLGVPFTVITDDKGGPVARILGFDQPALAAALGVA